MVGKSFERASLMPEKWLVTTAFVAVALTAGAPANLGVAAAAASSTKFVSNVDELYEEVNKVANSGAAVVMSRGEYTLSATDASGALRPNGGRLELQSNMSLYGVAGDRAAVVIDASLLPMSSFTVPFGRTGVIRVGRGIHAIEWLTVKGNQLAAAAVETDLPGASPTVVRIAHVVTENTARGVDVRNVGTGNGNAGRPIQADIEDSEFSRGIEGIRVVNFVGAHGGLIAVNMRRNRYYAQEVGCLVANNRSNSASIAVRSEGDRFEDNGLGCLIAGGLVGAATGSANLNRVTFEAYGSQFSNNTRTEFFTLPGGAAITDHGGLLVLGAQVSPTGAPNATSGNTVVVRLWDSAVAGNQNINFEAFGARSQLNSPALAGTGNRAVIELRGTSRPIEVAETDSQPDDPNRTNTVTIFRVQ
jgi:hypothetical protein